MQDGLFGPQRNSAQVLPMPPESAWHGLVQALPSKLHLGTSSWGYSGWDAQVWDDHYSAAELAQNGLGAYSTQPLLRCVGIDRSFYRPLTALPYARCAEQGPDDFRFVVKALCLVTDGLLWIGAQLSSPRWSTTPMARLDRQAALAMTNQPPGALAGHRDHGERVGESSRLGSKLGLTAGGSAAHNLVEIFNNPSDAPCQRLISVSLRTSKRRSTPPMKGKTRVLS